MFGNLLSSVSCSYICKQAVTHQACAPLGFLSFFTACPAAFEFSVLSNLL